MVDQSRINRRSKQNSTIKRFKNLYFPQLRVRKLPHSRSNILAPFSHGLKLKLITSRIPKRCAPSEIRDAPLLSNERRDPRSFDAPLFHRETERRLKKKKKYDSRFRVSRRNTLNERLFPADCSQRSSREQVHGQDDLSTRDKLTVPRVNFNQP